MTSNGPTITVDVYGVPAPQGSKKGFVNPRTRQVTLVESSAKVKPWRATVRAATFRAARGVVVFQTGPVRVTVDFYLHRPTAHSGTGRNAALLRKSAPRFPHGLPDVDKLVRATLDGISESKVWRDDSQVTTLIAKKRYADGRPPGARIIIETDR